MFIDETKVGKIFYPRSLRSKREYLACRHCIYDEIRKYLKNERHQNEWFTVNDIFGKENKDWEAHDLSIIILYKNRLNQYSHDDQCVLHYNPYDESNSKISSSGAAYRQAAIDLGHLVKYVLNESEFKFDIHRSYPFKVKYKLLERYLVFKHYVLEVGGKYLSC